MKAIWKVRHDSRDHWYGTKKEAAGFCDGATLDHSLIERIEIGCYLNPNQLVAFIVKHFSNVLAN